MLLALVANKLLWVCRFLSPEWPAVLKTHPTTHFSSCQEVVCSFLFDNCFAVSPDDLPGDWYLEPRKNKRHRKETWQPKWTVPLKNRLGFISALFFFPFNFCLFFCSFSLQVERKEKKNKLQVDHLLLSLSLRLEIWLALCWGKYSIRKCHVWADEERNEFDAKGSRWVLHSAQERLGIFLFYHEVFKYTVFCFLWNPSPPLVQEPCSLNFKVHISSSIHSVEY